MKHVNLRPASVRVFGRLYGIRFVDQLVNDDGDQLLGLCDKNALTIWVLTGQHPFEEADTVLHEILHAVYDVLQMDPEVDCDEESVASKFASGIMGVLADNPDLFPYIQAALSRQAALLTPKRTR